MERLQAELGHGYPFDWNINWGDGQSEHATGNGAANSEGITHEYAAPGEYKIKLSPAGEETAWMLAFGFSNILATTGAGSNENRRKFLSLDSPLTVAMFAEKDAAIVGNSVGYRIFSRLTGIGFHLGEDFGFDSSWDSVTQVGNEFFRAVFQYDKLTLPPKFTLPKNIQIVGNGFLHSMFQESPSVIMGTNFNIPQNISNCGQRFLNNMFAQCPNVVLNDIFVFPQLDQTMIDKTDNFKTTFGNAINIQTRTASSIINSTLYPITERNTFNKTGFDVSGIHSNWVQQ